jgi:hypothetical protein
MNVWLSAGQLLGPAALSYLPEHVVTGGEDFGTSQNCLRVESADVSWEPASALAKLEQL